MKYLLKRTTIDGTVYYQSAHHYGWTQSIEDAIQWDLDLADRALIHARNSHDAQELFETIPYPEESNQESMSVKLMGDVIIPDEEVYG